MHTKIRSAARVSCKAARIRVSGARLRCKKMKPEGRKEKVIDYTRMSDFSRRSLQAAACIMVFTSVLAHFAQAQQGKISVSTKALPNATLWNPYSFRLEATGGFEPYHWRINGSLPRNLEWRESGQITGTMNQPGQFEFIVTAVDRTGAQSDRKKLTLNIETPLSVAWSRKAAVNGSRIDGSVKVTNTTGRDVDLTFAVLAVNDIGRATAIGYQHFPLKKNTRNMELPFGDTLAPGNYVINVDVVGEEPVSKMIFRARLVTKKQAITQGR